MRTDATTFAAGGAIAITFGIIGALIVRLWICPADGNPVSYHLTGTAVLQNTGFDVTKCGATCTLTIDIRTNQTAAVTDTAACTTKNCFHLKDNGKGNWPLIMKDAGGTHPTYYDYVDGTVTIGP